MAIADVSGKRLEELISLEGRAAVVTGGAQGIGEAIARRLSEAGALVLIADQHGEKVEETAAEIDQTSPASVLGMAADVRNSKDLEAVAERAVSEFGRLDIWVNDAGLFTVKPALEHTDEDWERTIATDLSGPFYGARAAAKRMIEAGKGGVIVNIASSLGFHAVPDQVAYVSSKWGVRGLTAALAMELGEHGIRVVAVAPGLTRSEGMLEVMDALDRETGGDAQGQFASTLPLARLGEPDDIARAVLFAASDLAIFKTGSTLLVDGGEVYSSGATAASED